MLLNFFVCLWTDHRPLLQYVSFWLAEVRLISRKRIYSSFYLKPASIYFFHENRLTHFFILWQCSVCHEEQTCPFEASIHFSWKLIYLVVYIKSLQCYFREILPINAYIWRQHVCFFRENLFTYLFFKTVCNAVLMKTYIFFCLFEVSLQCYFPESWALSTTLHHFQRVQSILAVVCTYKYLSVNTY
jgi:hypothetical protein